MKTLAATAALLLIAACGPKSESGTSSEATSTDAAVTSTDASTGSDGMAASPAVPDGNMGSAKTVEDPGEPVVSGSSKPGKP